MITIKLNGANPEKIHTIIGGTLIATSPTADTATFINSDLNKLPLAQQPPTPH